MQVGESVGRWKLKLKAYVAKIQMRFLKNSLKVSEFASTKVNFFFQIPTCLKIGLLHIYKLYMYCLDISYNVLFSKMHKGF